MHVPEAPSPHERSMSVASHFPLAHRVRRCRSSGICPPSSDHDAQPGATNMMVTASEIAAKIEDAIKVDPASSLLTP